jgi:hypothetical protein
MKRKYKSTKTFALEPLESRVLFSRGDGVFSGFGSLTFSVAPDGTNIGREKSALINTLDQVAPTNEWQAVIARAIQTWISQADINLGRVDDSGAASGVFGPSRGDERFGDIRISGFNFATDSYAEAVDESVRSVGTWAGDIFFNTAVPWTSLTAIQTVALHELGHVLGLDHSTDPTSPMFAHGPSSTLQLTANDIAQLQAIHGVRRADPNEGNHSNDSIERASPIKGSDDDETVASGFAGNQVWIQFGDLLNAQDHDVFEVKTSPTYSGPIAFEVRSSGLSLSRLSAKVTDRNGNELGRAHMEGVFGDVLTISLSNTQADQKYYLHVSVGDDPFWAQGDYSVTIASPDQLAAKSESIAAWTQVAHRWYYDSERTKYGFSWQLLPTDDDEPEEDDGHSDDDALNAQPMILIHQASDQIVYRVVGTLSNLADVDHFRLDAPRNLNHLTELSLVFESLTPSGIVPSLTVLNGIGQPLAFETRVKGFGQTQIIVSNVTAEQRFIVRVDNTDVAGEFQNGSFSITGTFTTPSAPPEVLLQGTLNATTTSLEREWYIARPQLFALSLLGESANLSTGTIWVSVFNSQRNLVAGLVAPINELRSAPGLFLDAGSYYFQIAASTGTLPLPDIDVLFRTERPSQPIGPLLGDKRVQPMFLCPGSNTEYCYPNTTAPTIIPQKVGPPPSTPLPRPTTTQSNSTSDWFWGHNILPTNPTNALDVNADNVINAIDALVVINLLNARGIGPVPSPPEFRAYFDTNANGNVEAIDVLVVINYLNSRN